MKRFARRTLVIFVIVGAAIFLLSLRAVPPSISYGASFSPLYAQELGLDWRAVYGMMLDDLGVKHLRLSAYWPLVEPEQGRYSWEELDFQIREAKKHNADVILAVGRRLPRWPECHVPKWAERLPWPEQKKEIWNMVRAVVERYRSDPAIIMWQVENEPFLPVFANEHCGNTDKEFFVDELALVRTLDARPILVTDGGNFGTWAEAYHAGDVFGTSVYLYFWNETTGIFRTILPPAYYRVKTNLMRFLGVKPVILSELSLEPWLAASIHSVSLEDQLARMNADTFDEVITYARKTSFAMQYLWGVEWWYYMREHGHPEFWNRAKTLFNPPQ